jgi:hypothetical protein
MNWRHDLKIRLLLVRKALTVASRTVLTGVFTCSAPVAATLRHHYASSYTYLVRNYRMDGRLDCVV